MRRLVPHEKRSLEAARARLEALKPRLSEQQMEFLLSVFKERILLLGTEGTLRAADLKGLEGAPHSLFELERLHERSVELFVRAGVLDSKGRRLL